MIFTLVERKPTWTHYDGNMEKTGDIFLSCIGMRFNNLKFRMFSSVTEYLDATISIRRWALGSDSCFSTQRTKYREIGYAHSKP